MRSISTTVNPDGTKLDHNGKFDPSYKAIFKKDFYCIPIQNTLRPSRSLISEAKSIINKKLAKEILG